MGNPDTRGRDPRIHPRVGDVLRKDYTTRTVAAWTAHIVCMDVTGNKPGVKKSPTIYQFRKWARLATVVKRAEDAKEPK